MPDWLSELLARKLDNNPGRDMLLSAWNGERGYRWAALRTTGDDLMLDVDPRHSVLLESLHRVERLPRSAVAYSGWASFEQLTAQPIGKPWLQPPATDLVSEDVEIEVRNPAGNQVVVRSRSRVKSLRDGLRALSLALITERVLGSGERRPFKVTTLTVNGAAVPYLHWQHNLMVLMPIALNRNDSVVLETVTEGDILERPEGDTYWRLNDLAWYPRPLTGGIERAEFRIAVEANGAFVPFAGGEVVQRDTADRTRRS